MKKTLILILITGIIITSTFLISLIKKENEESVKSAATNTVTVENNIQIINVTALSSGYSPSKITANSGLKTFLRVKSTNSYGCERSFRIPTLEISKILPQSGVTEFDLGIPKGGEKIVGTCSMGMYTLTINFI